MSVRAYIGPGPSAGMGERIFLETPFKFRDVCKSLPGARWSPGLKAWHVPATTASALAVMNAFDGEMIEATEQLQALLGRAAMQVGAQRMKTASDLDDIPTKTVAWAHQRRAFHFARQLDAAMLAMDMGTGKSMVAIALMEEWDVKTALILCPLSVIGVWPKEIQKHAKDPSAWHITAVDARVPTAARAEQIAKGILTAQKLGKRSISIINYEAAWREAVKLTLKAVKWDITICDESHRIKSAGGKASTFASALRDISIRRLALTGTPMPHSPLDIYAQYRFLDPGIYGTSKNRFINRYAIMGGFENRQVKGWQNTDDLQKRFASIAFIVSKEDALPDLPEKMPPVERDFELSTDALLIYKQMENDFIAQVEDGVVVANNALAKTLRLRQITTGHTRDENGRVRKVDDGREKLLADVLTEIPKGEPVVVFSVFHPDLDATERVAKQLGLRYGELSGRRRDGLTDEATMSPDIDILGCQMKSGGVGIDLTRSCYAIYYSMGYELGDYRQSEDRLHRPGQTRPVRYICLVAKDTIDRVVYKALQSRQDIITAVIEAAKAHQL